MSEKSVEKKEYKKAKRSGTPAVNKITTREI